MYLIHVFHFMENIHIRTTYLGVIQYIFIYVILIVFSLYYCAQKPFPGRFNERNPVCILYFWMVYNDMYLEIELKRTYVQTHFSI